MIEATATPVDRRVIIGGAHQVMQVGDLLGSHGHEQDGHLAVTFGGQAQHAALSTSGPSGVGSRAAV